VLLGFSQGAAMALHSAAGTAPGGDGPAAEPLPVAGVVACSGYPHPGWQPAAHAGDTPEGHRDLQVLLTHGEQDPVVPHGASVELERLLLQAGATVELLSFSGGHTIDPDLFAAMRTFIERCWR
jgi:phospholipase/carboxylesterase